MEKVKLWDERAWQEGRYFRPMGCAEGSGGGKDRVGGGGLMVGEYRFSVMCQMRCCLAGARSLVCVQRFCSVMLLSN